MWRTKRSEAIIKRETELKARKIRICNICGWRGEKFLTPYNTRMGREYGAVCPECGSGPPQRILFKYLRKHFLSDYLDKISHRNFLCLEVGPDPSNPVEKALNGIVYISVDLGESHAMFPMDLTALTFKDKTFDLIVCSHVLEHIQDDATAMRQIYRVLRDDGVALIQIPIGYYDDPDGKSTVEFGERKFYEHFRSYGFDIQKRLEGAGFTVNVVRYNDYDATRLGIETETVFECKRNAQ